MEKLKGKFREFIDNWDCMVKFPHGNENCILPELYGCIAEDCAEEAKKLALAFANYQENSQYNEDKYMPQKALFNKFIEDYYKD